jgi:hypothetical protein
MQNLTKNEVELLVDAVSFRLDMCGEYELEDSDVEILGDLLTRLCTIRDAI